jgi:hypothetical protein
VPEAGDRVREARASRASDLRFYVGALLRPDLAERRDILAAERQDPRSESSYAQIVARRRGGTAATVVTDVLSRIGGQRERLARLASLLPARRSSAVFDVASVMAELESARERFENAAADALFAEATRFSPGRISTASLERIFDLEWIARTLRWDPPRARAWAATRREAFETDLAELVVPRILVHAGLGSEDELPERVLDGLAALYATSPSPAGRRGSAGRTGGQREMKPLVRAENSRYAEAGAHGTSAPTVCRQIRRHVLGRTE